MELKQDLFPKAPGAVPAASHEPWPQDAFHTQRILWENCLQGTGVNQWPKGCVADHAYSLHFYALWLPTENALVHKSKSKNRAPFLITPEAREATKPSSLRECFGRPSKPPVLPVHLNCPGRLRGAVPNPPSPTVTGHSSHHTAGSQDASREAVQRQHGMHNSWIFAARWASIMHYIKTRKARAWSRQFKEAAWAKQMPKKWKICPNCNRVLGYFSYDTVNRLSSKISNTWEEITEIFKDTIFVFWMLIWHKGVCMRECL